MISPQKASVRNPSSLSHVVNRFPYLCELDLDPNQLDLEFEKMIQYHLKNISKEIIERVCLLNLLLNLKY